MAETNKRNILAQPVRIRNQAPDVIITLDQQQIKEIAGQLDCGFRAFCHETTGELVFITNTQKFPLGDLDDFEEDNKRLEANRDEFINIEAMKSHNSYRVMVDFAEQLTDTKLQDKLLRALNKRGPFIEFKFVIDNSGDFRQQWFAFKDQQYLDWVTKQLHANQIGVASL